MLFLISFNSFYYLYIYIYKINNNSFYVLIYEYNTYLSVCEQIRINKYIFMYICKLKNIE